jgi:transposase
LVRTKKEQLALLEQQSQLGHIDLFYVDETGVSKLAYVPYGWQQKGENIVIPAHHGKQLNCFGILSRNNEFFSKTTTKAIDVAFIVEFFDAFSLQLQKQTVVVLDNARIHTAQKIKERIPYWQKRGLYIFYLPPYCPHLNIIERLWKEIKGRCIRPEDYRTFDDLHYATNNCLKQVGKSIIIKFSKYS